MSGQPEGTPTLLTPEAQAWAEREYPTHEVQISARDIARFAHATGESDPRYFDRAAAQAQGYADVVAPPMFYVLLRVEPSHLRPRSELAPDGSPAEDIPPIKIKGAMAGETTLTITRPFVAGETISCHKRLRGLTEKSGRSGPLLLLDFEYRYDDERGETVVLEEFTRILR